MLSKLTLYIVNDRINEYGAVGGKRGGRGNQSTSRKPMPVPLCPPQILHDLWLNPGHHDGKSLTNRLSYGIAPPQCRIWGSHRCGRVESHDMQLEGPRLQRLLTLLKMQYQMTDSCARNWTWLQPFPWNNCHYPWINVSCYWIGCLEVTL
jgi:hypothetical protein